VDCAEREVAAESFLAAVASRMPDSRRATAFMSDPDEKLADKLETILSFFDREPSLLVFNDYHKVSQREGLERFFTRAVQRAGNVKVVLTTRRRPSCLDNPTWPPGAVIDKALPGLTLAATQEFVRAKRLSAKVDPSQIKIMWERTSGNPYALGFFLTLWRDSGWSDRLRTLPLYGTEQTDEWAYSLLEILSGDARSLAYRLSVVRTGLHQDLLTRISNVSAEAALILSRELVDKYVLQELPSGKFLMYEFIREFLYSKAPDGTRRKAHSAAGSYFDRMARDTEDKQTQAECLLQAVDHFERSERWDALLRNAHLAFEVLGSFGDANRSHTVAERATKAARALGDNEKTVLWLLRTARGELDLGRLQGAKHHLTEALSGLPRADRDLSVEDGAGWLALEAQIYTQKGRLAYELSDLGVVDEYFTKGLTRARQCHERSVLADSLYTVGRIERRRGQYGRAEAHLSEAEAIALELGDERLSGACTTQRGLIARRQGNFDQARRHFSSAFERARALGDLHAAAINCGLLADLALRDGEFEEAEQLFRERLEDERRGGTSRGIRITVGQLAEALIGLARYQEAEPLLEEAEKLSREANDGIGIAWGLRRRGLLEHAKGHTDIGNRLIREGIEQLKETGNKDYLPDFEKALRDTANAG